MKIIKQHSIISGLITYILIIFLLSILNNHCKIIGTDCYELIKTTSPIVIALLVYLYTTDNHKRQLLNELDSKSEWRKILFDIAGKKDIEIGDVFQLRAGLRFTEKNIACSNNYFDKMNFIIIRYCKIITKENDINNLKENKEKFMHNFIKKVKKENSFLELDITTQETIRLFCRYMLADHWEKNQDRNFRIPKNKEKELVTYTLYQFIKLNANTNDSFNQLCSESTCIIKSICTSPS